MIQALAGVLGGTQSIYTNNYDKALVLPSEETVRVTLRTQQTIAEESGAADIVDPLGGRFAIEALTDEMEDGILGYLAEIEELAGCGTVDVPLHLEGARLFGDGECSRNDNKCFTGVLDTDPHTVGQLSGRGPRRSPRTTFGITELRRLGAGPPADCPLERSTRAAGGGYRLRITIV